jgi:hypothetical protein
MSELSRRIGRVQRREAVGGMGFGAAPREHPRAMLLAARATDAASASAAAEAGADVIVFDGVSASVVKAAIKDAGKACAGAAAKDLDEATAAKLIEAGSDFVISPLATTASAAVDTEKMGQVVALTGDISDAALRSLGPLGFDAILVEGEAAAPTLADQLELVRLSSFSGLPLAVNVQPSASVAELRVLRDSGAVLAVAPPGTSPEQLKQLAETLTKVPAARKGAQGSAIALVPSLKAHADEDDEDEDPE